MMYDHLELIAKLTSKKKVKEASPPVREDSTQRLGHSRIPSNISLLIHRRWYSPNHQRTMLDQTGPGRIRYDASRQKILDAVNARLPPCRRIDSTQLMKHLEYARKVTRDKIQNEMTYATPKKIAYDFLMKADGADEAPMEEPSFSEDQKPSVSPAIENDTYDDDMDSQDAVLDNYDPISTNSNDLTQVLERFFNGLQIRPMKFPKRPK
ncbi:unnamed protein product, partial [Mesorhabditis spiculigera]